MSHNPYQAPTTLSENPETDSPTREDLANAIRSWLADDSTAFEFGWELDVFQQSADPVIRFVSEAIWFHYDDVSDHLVCLSKSEWDFHQRLLLLLEADCCVETRERWTWSIRQIFAVMAFIGFLYCVPQCESGNDLLILAIPFAVFSMLLAHWRRKPPISIDPYKAVVSPFATLQDLEVAYRSCTFRKTRYPKSVSERRVRSPLMERFMQVYLCVVWWILAPMVLFFQSLPSRETEILARANVGPVLSTR